MVLDHYIISPLPCFGYCINLTFSPSLQQQQETLDSSMEENKLSHMMSMPTWSSRKVVSSQLEANEKVKNNSQECNEKGNKEAEEEGHVDVEETGRERLKRLREEVSMEDNNKVNIPENWGQEQKLKDWMDYTMFDAFFPHTMIVTARDALIANARKAKSPRLY